MSYRSRGGGMMGGDIWLQWFSCCINQQTHQKRHSARRRPAANRPRIDRSMIGNPTNFQHTGHIGSGDVALATDSRHLDALQNQMQSKGGYEMAIKVF